LGFILVGCFIVHFLNEFVVSTPPRAIISSCDKGRGPETFSKKKIV
jgi:hypothetical protein